MVTTTDCMHGVGVSFSHTDLNDIHDRYVHARHLNRLGRKSFCGVLEKSDTSSSPLCNTSFRPLIGHEAAMYDFNNKLLCLLSNQVMHGTIRTKEVSEHTLLIPLPPSTTYNRLAQQKRYYSPDLFVSSRGNLPCISIDLVYLDHCV